MVWAASTPRVRRSDPHDAAGFARIVALRAGCHVKPLTRAIRVAVTEGARSGAYFLRYPLSILTVNAQRFCLGSIACHNLLTLKWVCEKLYHGEDGQNELRDTRCGLSAVGMSLAPAFCLRVASTPWRRRGQSGARGDRVHTHRWIGWHGFGTKQFQSYLDRRACEGPTYQRPGGKTRTLALVLPSSLSGRRSRFNAAKIGSTPQVRPRLRRARRVRPRFAHSISGQVRLLPLHGPHAPLHQGLQL